MCRGTRWVQCKYEVSRERVLVFLCPSVVACCRAPPGCVGSEAARSRVSWGRVLHLHDVVGYGLVRGGVGGGWVGGRTLHLAQVTTVPAFRLHSKQYRIMLVSPYQVPGMTVYI